MAAVVKVTVDIEGAGENKQRFAVFILFEYWLLLFAGIELFNVAMIVHVVLKTSAFAVGNFLFFAKALVALAAAAVANVIVVVAAASPGCDVPS